MQLIFSGKKQQATKKLILLMVFRMGEGFPPHMVLLMLPGGVFFWNFQGSLGSLVGQILEKPVPFFGEVSNITIRARFCEFHASSVKLYYPRKLTGGYPKWWFGKSIYVRFVWQFVVFFKLCPDAQCIVYLPTFTINQLNVGKYTIPMEPMGMGNLWVSIRSISGVFHVILERHGNLEAEGFSKIISQAMSKLDEVLQARKKDVLNFDWFP